MANTCQLDFHKAKRAGAYPYKISYLYLLSVYIAIVYFLLSIFHGLCLLVCSALKERKAGGPRPR
jgi:hypothetical protein